MSDLISMGSSGVLAYQRALGTVANNIANIGTDGYSRQEIGLAAAQPRAIGNDFVGTGVYTTGVKRAYDSFVESNLRNSTSDLEGQGPMVQFANRVVDLLSDENVGLSSSLGAFFASARDLATAPASVVARGNFLRQTDAVATGFRQLSGQIASIDSETTAALDVTAEKINALSNQIALVNKQLFRVSSVDRQPPELLDQRDMLLRDLSKLVRINTEFTVNGQVKVSLNDSMDSKTGAVIVDADQVQRLNVVTDPDTQRVQLGLNMNSARARVVVGVSGGEMGGLLAVRDQVVQPARDQLDGLAQRWMNEVNAIHQSGVDAQGQPGGDLLGLTPDKSAALGIMSLISDPQKVAAAGPLRVLHNELNISNTKAAVEFQNPTTQTPTGLSTLFSPTAGMPGTDITLAVGTLTGAATLTAGTQNAVVYFDTEGQWPQLITKDGRHLLGTPLTAGQQSLLLDHPSMSPGAAYDVGYLNPRETDSAYLKASYFIGVKASALSTPEYSLTSDDPHRSQSLVSTSAHIQSRFVDDASNNAVTIAAGQLRLNGAELTAYAGSNHPEDLATWLNTQTADTGVEATVTYQEMVIKDPITSVESVQRQASLVLTAESNTDEVRLGFVDAGDPADLETMGFRTALYWDGEVPEDLLIFVSDDNAGASAVTIQMAADFSQKPFNALEALRANPVDVQFLKDGQYTLTDVNTGTVLAERSYDPHQGQISYNGFTLKFTGIPVEGDRFRVDGNRDGVGDNANIKAMAELEFKRQADGYSISDAYRNQISRVGNVARQSTIVSEALTVVNQQAIEARDAIAGVSLDEEAANLIRFQQAYQANAKVMQTATSLFDALLAIR
ncbi:FlgK Flagellar hook-associated protein [Burkholderiaceae bacterium]